MIKRWVFALIIALVGSFQDYTWAQTPECRTAREPCIDKSGAYGDRPGSPEYNRLKQAYSDCLMNKQIAAMECQNQKLEEIRKKLEEQEFQQQQRDLERMIDEDIERQKRKKRRLP